MQEIEKTKGQNRNTKGQIPKSEYQSPNTKIQIPKTKYQKPKSKYQSPIQCLSSFHPSPFLPSPCRPSPCRPSPCRPSPCHPSPFPLVPLSPVNSNNPVNSDNPSFPLPFFKVNPRKCAQYDAVHVLAKPHNFDRLAKFHRQQPG